MTVNSDRYTLHTGDCLQVLQGFADNSVDTVLTDPPYALTNRIAHLQSCLDCGRVMGGADGNNKVKTCPRCKSTNIGRRRSHIGPGFMGNDWDTGLVAFAPEIWMECLRVAKPGAMLMAFGGTRTWHRLAVAIEDAGWEIRDTIMWVHGQGFPKSHDVSKGIDTLKGAERETIGVVRRWGNNAGKGRAEQYKNSYEPTEIGAEKFDPITKPATPEAEQWDGYGTQLKPAWEPIILAMKPLDGTYAENALKWGVGGLWIDGARIATNGEKVTINTWDDGGKPFGGGAGHEFTSRKEDGGRWPSNLVHDGSEEVVKLFPQSDGQQANVRGTETSRPSGDSGIYGERARVGFDARNDSGSAARFFYVAKASRLEREAGLWDAGEQDTAQRYGSIRERNNYQKQGQDRVRNPHPTVKPLALMRYLCRLTRMPTGGIVLDPFMGSGSTGAGALMEDRTFVGIDLNPAYVEIARNRIEFWKDKAHLLDEEGKLDTQAVRWDRDNVTGGQQALFGGSND